MVQPISNLAVGAKVKSLNTKYNGVPIVWQVGHKADGRVKLISEKIITLKCFDAKEASNPDNNRKQYGNNRYSQSNIDQWLNSAAGAGAWYSARHTYDAPPNNANVWSNYNEYDAEAGFLSNFEEAFRNAILDTTIRVVKSSVDGGGYEDITRKVYLLSNTEVGLADESGVAEGSKWDLFSDDNSRKAYPTAEAVSASEYTDSSLTASSPWYWWLRTPSADYSIRARFVDTNGALNNYYAYHGLYGVRPALEVGSGILVSDTPDTDGAYIINWTERHEGGSTATLGIAAEGAGTKTAHGGGEAGVVVGAEGAGEGTGLRIISHIWRPGQIVPINLPDRGIQGEYLIQRVTIRRSESFDKWTFAVEYGGRLSGIADFLRAMVSAQQKKNLAEVNYLSKYVPGEEAVDIVDEWEVTPCTTPWICGDADAICGEIVCLDGEEEG